MPIDRSAGYAGTVNDEQWSELIRRAGGNRYGVAGLGEWAVSSVPGDRALQVSAGAGWGLGVLDEIDDPHPLNLDAVTVGTSRWDLIVVRRAWSAGVGGASTIHVIKGSSARAIPPRSAGFPLDDQPLALVRVAAGQTVVQEIIDLRVVPGPGGLVAFDELALTYLTDVGTVVRIGSTVWSRGVNATGSPVWVPGAAAVATYQVAVNGLPDGVVYRGFAVTPIPDETTDTGFVLSRTGSVFALRRGLYQVSFTVKTLSGSFTGRTFAEVKMSGLTDWSVARNNSVDGEDTVTVTTVVYISEDNVTLSFGYFKTTGTVNNHGGRITVARLG